MSTPMACCVPIQASALLGNRLEHQPREGIAPAAQLRPAGFGRTGFAVQERAPEGRHPLHVPAVDGYPF